MTNYDYDGTRTDTGRSIQYLSRDSGWVLMYCHALMLQWSGADWHMVRRYSSRFWWMHVIWSYSVLTPGAGSYTLLLVLPFFLLLDDEEVTSPDPKQDGQNTHFQPVI